MTTLYNKIYSISVDEKRITFFRRGIGDKGRDIAAVKIALGDVYQAEIPNNSPDDTTIGKQWFNCEGAQESLDSVLTFNNRLRKSLMNYQIQHQFIILNYYWENMSLCSTIRSSEDVYMAVQKAVEIFDSEFGRIGEGTIACLHGWRPNSTASNRSYFNVEKRPVDQIPMFLYEMINNGAIHRPPENIVSRFYESSDWAIEASLQFDTVSVSSKKWKERILGMPIPATYVQYEASSIIGQIVESPLYVASRTVVQQIQQTGIEDLTPEQRADAISRALEPNHLTADFPFMITNFKIGFFDKTQYTFTNLPNFNNLTAQEQTTLEQTALAKVADFYNKKLTGQQDLSMINFIDFRSPSLRPGDVYRAYFEINKALLDALPGKQGSITSKEEIFVKNNNIQLRELEQQISDAFCADGRSLSDAEARVQYEKYKSFANKKKLEISRKLRSAAMRIQEDADSIDGIEVDLGVFGKGNLTQNEIQSLIVSGVSAGVEWAKKDNPKAIDPQITSYELQLTGLEIKDMSRRISRNFEATKDDFENYELGGTQGYLFDVLEEARYVSNIYNDLVATVRNAESINTFVDSVSPAVASTAEELVSRDDTLFTITFTEDELGSKIETIHLESMAIRQRITVPEGSQNTFVGRSAKIYSAPIWFDVPDDSPAAGAPQQPQYNKLIGSLKRSRTVNYLRNFKKLDERSGFFESMFDMSKPCPPDDEKSSSGYGVAYVLKYTKQVTPEDKEDDYNPVHNWSEERKSQTTKKPDKKTDSKYGLLKFKKVKEDDRTFGFENALPMIGEECTYDDIMKLLSNDKGTGLLDMKRLLCEFAACLGLPDFNIKVPNIGNIRWPELPTIEIPGLSGKQVLELMKSILRRAACTLIKGIIDILKTPFCEDKFIDGIYGAGSGTAPHIQRAMAEGFLDLGIPTTKKENIKNFIDGVMNVLSPGELCALFEGDAVNEEALTVVATIARSYDLGQELFDEESITNFFITIGLFVGSEITSALCRYQVEKETCQDVYSLINQVRAAASRGEDVTPQQIEEAAAAAQQELERKANAFELLGNQSALTDLLPDLGSVEANPIFSKPAPIIERAANTAARSIFSLARTSFVSSLNSYVSSFYVTRPGLVGVDDGEYNSSANLKIQRAVCNLDRFSKLNLDLSSMGSLGTTQNLRKAILILSDDYETEMYDNGVSDPFPIYKLNAKGQIEQNASMLLGSLVDSFRLMNQQTKQESRSLQNRTDLKSVFSRLLPFSAGELDESTRTATTFEHWQDMIYQGQGLDGPDIVTLNTSYLNKMNQLLTLLQEDIVSSTESAFLQKTDSLFLEGIKDFYNIELEAAGRPNGKELVETGDSNESLTTTLRHPLPDLTERIKIKMVDRTIPDPFESELVAAKDLMKTTITVTDPFFFGEETSFNFCEAIPERLRQNISEIVGSESSRAKAYKSFYKNMLKENIRNYSDSSTSSKIDEVNNAFAGNSSMISESFKYAYEGIMEQMAGSIYGSRIFDDPDYVNRLDLKVRSKFFFDPSSGCYRNPNSLLKYGALNFDFLVSEMFSEQYLREYASPENSPLLEDYTTPGAFERAMMNTTVHGFIKLCLVEFLMKGAVSFSVWDIDFVRNNTFFKEYLIEFVKRQFELQQGFAQYRAYVDDTLSRLAGTNNVDSALRTIVTRELNSTISDISKNLFENDARTNFTGWFVETLPFYEISSRKEDNPAPYWVLNVPTEEISIYRKNSFAFLEEYVRIRGQLRGFRNNNTEIAQAQSAQLDSRRVAISSIINTSNLQDVELAGYDISNPQYINIEEFEDTDDFPEKEVMSVDEFSAIIRSLLDNNSELSRYFNDLTRKIHEPTRPTIHGLPETLREHIPIKLIKRKRKLYVFDKNNIFSGKFRVPSFLKDTDVNDNFRRGRDKFRRQNQGQNIQDHSSYSYSWLVTGDSDNDYGGNVSDASMNDLIEQTFNSGESTSYRDRYYIVGVDSNELESIQSNSNSGQPYQITDFRPRMDSTPYSGATKYIPSLSNTFPILEYSYEPKDLLVRNIDGENQTQFTNWRGEVTEEIFNQYIEDYPEIEVETWEESVVDLVEKASPTYNYPGESRWSPRDVFSNEQLESMGAGLERQLRWLCHWSAEDGSGAIDNPGIFKRAVMNTTEEWVRENIAGTTSGPYKDEIYKYYVFVTKETQQETSFGSTGDAITKACPCSPFGYTNPKKWQDMLHGEQVAGNTFANNTGIKTTRARSSWAINDPHEFLDVNEYKIPTRLLITQIKDSSNNITQSYVRYIIPKFLNFRNTSTNHNQHRANMLHRATMETLSGYEDYIKESYREKMMWYYVNDKDYYDNWSSPFADPEDPAGSYIYPSEVVQKVLKAGVDSGNSSHAYNIGIGPFMRYPGGVGFQGRGGGNTADWCALPATAQSENIPADWNLVTYARRGSWCSSQKLYSIACQIEARDHLGNFSITESDLDQQFHDRGHLVRKPKRANLSYANVKEIIDRAARRYQNESGTQTGEDLGIIEASYKAIFLAGRLAYHDLYRYSIQDMMSNYAGTESDVFVPNPGRALLLTIGNFITWFNQKRIDGFWGATSKDPKALSTRDDGSYSQTIKTIKDNMTATMAYPDIFNNLVEGSAFRCGASLFYNDRRISEYSYFLDYRNSNSRVRPTQQDYGENGAWKTTNREKFDRIWNFLNDTVGASQNMVYPLENGLSQCSFVNTYTYGMRGADYNRSFANTLAWLAGELLGKPALYSNTEYSYLPIPKDPFSLGASGIAMLFLTRDEAEQLGLTLNNKEAIEHWKTRSSTYVDHAAVFSDLQENEELYQRASLSLPSTAARITAKYNAVLSDWGLNQIIQSVKAGYTQRLEGDETIVSDILRDSNISYGIRLCMTEKNPTARGLVESIFGGTAVTEEERIGRVLTESFTDPGTFETHWIFPIASFEKDISELDCYLGNIGWAVKEKLREYLPPMKVELAKEQSFQDFFGFIIPTQNFASMLTIHGASMLAGYGDMPALFSSTKSSLASAFPQVLKVDPFGEKSLMIDSDQVYSDYGMGPAGGAGPECFSGPNIAEWAKMLYEMIKQYIKYFPSVILRGLADALDPAYKEMKRHYLSCELPDLTNKSWGASSGNGSIPLGLRGSRPQDKRYAPLVPAFPVDVGKATVRAIRGDFGPMGVTISKLISYIYSGFDPFLDFSYAFQIPCLELNQESMNGWSKYQFGDYGRYGHPLGILSLLALQTLQLPGDIDLKNNLCPRPTQAIACDELE